MAAIKTFRELEVYQLAHKLAMDVFFINKGFPHEERYLLTDQIRRSSMPVAGNIAEGGKRKYEELFKKYLIDSMGFLEETKSWLLFSLDCEYITNDQYQQLLDKSEEFGAKLYRLHDNWKS